MFHYSDGTGRDFGWHREPNPHVDRLAHFQTRDAPDAAYEYEPVHFEALSPIDLLWDILERIESRVS